MNPRVSVCCSVLNQRQWFMEMVGSVYLQTFQDWELIVVDDGSTDDIRGVVEGFKDPRIKLIVFPENKGIPFGINRAFRSATGEFVQALAADELLDPNKLAQQVAYLDEHKELDAVWGLPSNGEFGTRPSWEQYVLKAHNRSNETWLRTLLLLEHVPLGSCSMLFRHSVFDKIGYFDESLTAFVDHEWFCRFFEKGLQGRVTCERWAVSRPNPDGISYPKPEKAELFAREIARVRELHPLQLPSPEGRVSVGIPVFNMAKWLPDAVASVVAQSVPVHEILILDDASTDNLTEVVQGLNTLTVHGVNIPIRFLKFDENRGNMEAQNQMLAQAEGEFFVPLSADDVLDPTFIEKCLAEFKDKPYTEFVASQTDFIGDDGKDFPDKKHPFYGIPQAVNRSQDEWKHLLYYGNHYFGVGMYRTYALLGVGGWNKSFGVISDYEMYLRLLHRENIRIIEEKLTHTRIHGGNQSLLDAEKGALLPQQYHDARKVYFPQRRKVIFATPFYELRGFSPYISSLFYTSKLLTSLGINSEFWENSGDSYVDRAKNTLFMRFLEDPDATDMFMIDSDMQWDVQSVVKILMLPEEVITGSYPMKNAWGRWTGMPVIKEGDDGLHHPVGRDLGDGTALMLAENYAGGFVHIKRSVLERYAEFYKDLWYQDPSADPGKPDRKYIEFFTCERHDNKKWGEDRVFGKRLQAMGIDIFIYPNVTFGHYGVKGWMGNFDHFLKHPELQTTHMDSDPIIQRVTAA